MIKLKGMHDIERLHDWEKDKISILGLQLSKRCNFGTCLYCFEDAGLPDLGELTFLEIQSLIQQAKKLDCQRVFIAGAGEPLLNEFFVGLAEFVTDLGMGMVVYTNGSLITKELAQQFYPLNISFLVKLDSLTREHSNSLTGGDFYHLQKRGLENLIQAGFNENISPDFTRLGVAAVFTLINEDDIEELIRFCERNRLYLSVDELGIVGRAESNYDLLMPRKPYLQLTKRLKTLFWQEEKECFYRNSGIVIRHNGDVASCTEDSSVVGNIRDSLLPHLLLKIREEEPHYHYCQTCPIKQKNRDKFLKRRENDEL